jgi:hypothetical protein
MTTTKTVYLSNPSVTIGGVDVTQNTSAASLEVGFDSLGVNDVRRYRAPLRVGAPNGERHLDNVSELRRRRN